MTRTPPLRRLPRHARTAALLAFVALSGCRSLLSRTPPPRQGPAKLRYDVARVLDVAAPDPAYYRRRARLEVMGPQLDSVLAAIVSDPNERENVRANGATLLADRQGAGATRVLATVLAGRSSDEVRAAAAAGLQRFAADSPSVKQALRSALADPSERVRLAALQGMDVEDAPVIRTVIRRDESRQVRTVARQLLTLFEARGAPLAADPRGDLRSTGEDSVPRIVFHVASGDPAGRVKHGALWVEPPGGKTLIPLAQEVEVVGDVVPAFFDSQRRVVVFEGDGRIQARDVRAGQTRAFGPGIAPRPIPFTDRFVFLREVAGSSRPEGGGVGTDYTVLRAPFAGGPAEEVGMLHAIGPTGAPENTVRTMVVGETGDGFVLRGPGITPFVLPGPYGQ